LKLPARIEPRRDSFSEAKAIRELKGEVILPDLEYLEI